MHRSVLTPVRAPSNVIGWSGMLLAAVACSGCFGSLPTAPPILSMPGIKLETRAFTRDVLTAFARERSNRVMHIGQGAPNEIMILTEQGIRWIDGSGTTIWESPFAADGRVFRPLPINGPDDQVLIAGLEGKDTVALFGLDGRLRHKFDTGNYDWPVVADVMGDSRIEFIARLLHGASIIDLEGTTVGALQWSRYTTSVETMQADADPQSEIVMFNTHLGRPNVEVRVANADGSVIADWVVPEGNWLFAIPELGNDRLWSAVGDDLVARSANGTELTRLSAPAAGYLRYVSGVRLGDLTIMLVSGGGYRCNSLLFVYDKENQLVYQEALTARSYALWADDDANAFLVGSGETVYRYRPVAAKLRSQAEGR